MCFPTLNGIDLNPYKLPLAKSPIWNYDMMFKSKEIIAKERLRFGNAWFSYFGDTEFLILIVKKKHLKLGLSG